MAINIIPLKVLRRINTRARFLSNENVRILGFNQHSQETIGSIKLRLRVGSLVAETKFSIIDASTTYNAILGRPWLHDNEVVPSTLHQCMKYVKNGIQIRINGDIEPYEVHKANPTDPRRSLPRKGENKSKGKEVEEIISPIVPNWRDNTMSFEDWKEMLTGGTWERNSDEDSMSC